MADGDTALCTRGSGHSAIAACERVLARPDPVKWIGLQSQLLAGRVYRSRGEVALKLGDHLSAAGRERDALAASERAIQFLERYERERAKPLTDEAPETKSAALTLGLAYAAAGVSSLHVDRWADGSRYLRQAVVRVPGQALLWGSLGVATNQTGDFSESAAAFAKAFELDANYFAAPRTVQRQVWDSSREGRRFTLPSSTR